MNILEKTDFKNLGEKYVGKVRDVYNQKDKVIMISTDRYSDIMSFLGPLAPHMTYVLRVYVEK